MDNVNGKLNGIIDKLIINIENAQLHESVLIMKYITKFKLGTVFFYNTYLKFIY